MKALTPALSREARRETGVCRRPMRERGRRYPSPAGGRRWPEGPDEGAVIEPRIDALDWPALERELDAFGCVVAPNLLTAEDCRGLAALYADDVRFRSRIVMASHGFGRGEYKYFADPLPDLIVALRRGLYRRLAPLADRWNAAMGNRCSLPRRARGVPRPLPCRGSDAADAASAALWAG